MIKISENYIGFVDINIGFTISIVFTVNVLLVFNIDSDNIIRLSISNISNIEGIKIIFKFSKDS